MRKTALASLMCGLALVSGCGSGESTDPKTLKPLTAADIAEINARDAQIEDEEDERRVEAPKTSSKSRTKSKLDGTGER